MSNPSGLDPNGPDFKTVQVAALLGLDRRTITNYCNDGTLECWRTKPRGPWRIPQQAVIDLRERGKPA
jgi:predicted site-specific integrase-resolvase